MEQNKTKGKLALQRVRARLSSAAAFRAATAKANAINPREYGYEEAALARQDSLRSHFGLLMDATDAQPGIAKPSSAEHDTLTRPPMTKEEKRFSRGLLGTVARFGRTSRGVCVRSGNPRYQEWARVKAADLKLTYALYLLENDMGHFRHMYKEEEQKKRVGGRMKYFQATPPTIRIPELWLEFPELAAGEDLRQPPAEWRAEKLLGVFPELWRSLHAARWPEIEARTAKKKQPKEKAAPKAPATTAPAKAPAAPSQTGDKAAPPKVNAPPGEGAAPPPAASKGAAPPPAAGKGAAPPPAAGKGGPPPLAKPKGPLPPPKKG